MSSTSSSQAFDFARLDRAVEALLEDHSRLRRENAALRSELAERDRKLGELGDAMARQAARRKAAIDRIDSLVARLGELDAMLERAEAREDDAGAPSTARAGAATP